MDDATTVDWIRPKSTINRPLLGVTILLIEDSRYCSEAMRLLSIRSGARLRRADCLKAARRHLRIYRPDVVLVDLGLPDGSGVEIIQDIMHGQSPLPAVIATSGVVLGSECDAALEAGAAYFMEKPITDLASFQQTILATLPEAIKPAGFTPRVTGVSVIPDTQALKDDLEHIDQLLEDCFKKHDKELLLYAAQFLSSLGQDTNSKRIIAASEKLKFLADSDVFTKDEVKQEFQIIQSVVDGRMAETVQVY